MLDHKITPPSQQFASNASMYHRLRIFQDVVRFNSFVHLQRLIQIVTEKVFIQQVFISDDWNCNVLEQGISTSLFKISQFNM